MTEPYYDLNEDWPLVVASFQSQYGIRLASDLESMSWREFTYLLQGLSGKSPLGQLIAIRAEKDPKKLKEFTPEQRKIRNEYLSKQARHKTPQQLDEALEAMKNAFISMAK